MTKNKMYKFGRISLKCMCRPVGHGYEICMKWDSKTIFVGNFVHKAEANRWWGMMCREIQHFTKTYWYNKQVTTTWYCNFFSNHLYRTYYAFLDKCFTKYNKTFARAVTRDVKRYRTMKRRWSAHHGHGQARFHLKAA